MQVCSLWGEINAAHTGTRSIPAKMNTNEPKCSSQTDCPARSTDALELQKTRHVAQCERAGQVHLHCTTTRHISKCGMQSTGTDSKNLTAPRVGTRGKACSEATEYRQLSSPKSASGLGTQCHNETKMRCCAYRNTKNDQSVTRLFRCQPGEGRQDARNYKGRKGRAYLGRWTGSAVQECLTRVALKLKSAGPVGQLQLPMLVDVKHVGLTVATALAKSCGHVQVKRLTLSNILSGQRASSQILKLPALHGAVICTHFLHHTIST